MASKLPVFLALYLVLAAAEDDDVIPDVVYSHGDKEISVTYVDENEEEVQVAKGDRLTPKLTHNLPMLEWEYEEGDMFTLILTDPDAPSRENPTFKEWVHWCVSNIPGDQIEKGAPKYSYVGAGPPKDTGVHRYVFLLYKQYYGQIEISSHFDHTEASAPHRGKWSAKKYAMQNNFGDPVGMFYFTAEYDEWSDKIFTRRAASDKGANKAEL